MFSLYFIQVFSLQSLQLAQISNFPLLDWSQLLIIMLFINPILCTCDMPPAALYQQHRGHSDSEH